MKLQFTTLSFLLMMFCSAVIFAQFNNVQVSKPGSNSPEEVTIAINRQNPSEMAAGANIRFFYNSSDSGRTWAQSNISSSSFGVWGDPCVIYDTTGNLYFAHLSSPPHGYWIDRIVVQKSTNNGLNWDNGAGIGFNSPKNQDKEWLAVDRTNSQFAGNIYLAWTEFDHYGTTNPMDSTRILFSRTSDEGENWSEPVRVSDVGGNARDGDKTVEGAVPAVGPNGEVYLSWAGPLGLVFDKSTDGGVTFGNDKIITQIPGGWDFAIPGISRADGLPITACDISNSQYRGNIYINWSDQRNGTDNTDIFFVKSTDNGETWSNVIKVNDDYNYEIQTQQFFSWMTVDESDGYIYIVFYDRRTTEGNYTDVYLARSTDGGETFKNYQINDESFLPDENVFFGDYINIDAYNGIIRPIWMSMNSGDLSVWTALLTESMFTTTISDFTLHQYLIFDILIDWNDNDPNVKSFDIERKHLGDLSWAKAATILADTSMNFPNFSYVDSNRVEGTYVYRIKQVNNDGSYSYTNIKNVYLVGPNEVSGNNIPKGFKLYQNYPNPFNPSTVISFRLPKRMYVKLEIFNLLGQKIETLVSGYKNAGTHESIFQTKSSNVKIGSGVYVYSLTADKFRISRKMVMLK